MTGPGQGSTSPQTAGVKGLVYGGQQPISGASVYMFAMSTTGSGQLSTSLLKNTADTQSGTYGYYVTPSGIAVDAAGVATNVSKGHVWTANYYSSSVSELELNNDGTVTVVSTGYTGGGLDQPNSVAIDGAGNVWITNFRGASITELQGASSSQPGGPISTSSGYGQDASLSAPFGVAIDASGNVWVSNQGSTSITEFLGAAAPVRTPLLGPSQLP
jgi:sugar lactone lactonase YvrE